jgi:hypothetical protein
MMGARAAFRQQKKPAPNKLRNRPQFGEETKPGAPQRAGSSLGPDAAR